MYAYVLQQKMNHFGANRNLYSSSIMEYLLLICLSLFTVIFAQGGCADNEFRCILYGISVCQPRLAFCDGFKQCHNGLDEDFCGEPDVCPGGWFRCENRRCIPSHWKCNDLQDCTDNSDEYNCYSAPTLPPSIVTRSPREVLNDEVGSAQKKLLNWFVGLGRNGTQTRKWGHQLPRIAVALFLADQEKFTSGNKTMYEMNYELTIQLLSKMFGGGHLKRRDLSLYIHALMVACVDPRNFHGRDLVAELRSDIESNNGTGSPFELLVLCNAGDAMSDRDVQRIATIFDSQHRPFWTDNQAMATMAMACVSAQPGVTVDERTLLDMAQELKKRQFRNGTVDSIKTTALVIQALAATESLERNFDFMAAIRALLAAQREDGSVGSFLDSYYVLPVLSHSNLLNIRANHCKRPEISESEALNDLLSSRVRRISITYSVVIGTDVDLKRTWTLKVPVNSTLYNIMEMVQKLDSRQQIKYNVIDGKPFVSSVMGIQDDVETGFYWFTYLSRNNSENSIMVEDSPVNVKIEANQELILWYKSGQWN